MKTKSEWKKISTSNTIRKRVKRGRRKKLSYIQLIDICDKLHLAIKSGLTIERGLQVIVKSSKDRLVIEVIRNILDNITAGKSLSEAIEAEGEVFPKIFSSMIKVGEATGEVEEVLIELKEYFQNGEAVRKKLAEVSVYPIFILVITLGVLIGVVGWIIPYVMNVMPLEYEDMPIITRGLVTLNYILSAYRMEVIIGIVILMFLLWITPKTKLGKRFKDIFCIRIPLIKNIYLVKESYFITYGLGMMIDKGVDVLNAVNIITETCGNSYMQDKMSIVEIKLRQGDRLSDSIAQVIEHDELSISILSTLEEVGCLGEGLKKAGKIYEHRLQRVIEVFKGSIQPIMILVVGIIVGSTIISIYIPLLRATTGIV